RGQPPQLGLDPGLRRRADAAAGPAGPQAEGDRGPASWTAQAKGATVMMQRYLQKKAIVSAAQWLSNASTILTVEYDAKGAYVFVNFGVKRYLNPGEWVVLQPGKLPLVMTDSDFRDTYELLDAGKRVVGIHGWDEAKAAHGPTDSNP